MTPACPRPFPAAADACICKTRPIPIRDGAPFFAGTSRRRRAAARSLLAQTYRSIESISRELGYCSVFDFSAKFKSYTGLSPSEFRRKAQAPYRDFFHTPLNLIK